MANTSVIAINSTGYTEIAVANAVGKITNNGSAAISVIFAATIPGANDVGHALQNEQFSLDGNTQKAWAKILGEGFYTSCDVAVTLGDSQSSVGDVIISSASDKFNINNTVDASATITYIGLESAAGEWCVRKIDTTSGVNIQYATVLNNVGTVTYATAWTNRAALTYNDYSGAF